MTAGLQTRQETVTSRPASNAAVQPKRRWSLLIGGLLLVLLCAGIFVVVQSSGDDTVQVLAVARPVAAGQLITAQDLRIVGVVPDPTVQLIRATEASGIVGRTAAVPLTEGTYLAQAQLGPAVFPPSGQAVVAVALKPGRLPIGLAPGSHVRVVTVAKESATDTPGLPAAPASVAASVVGVTLGVDGTGTSVVSLLLAQDDATKVAAAGSDLALVVVAG